MSDLKSQISVSADSEGVASGLESGKRAMKEFGRAAGDAGQQAAKGVAAIGEGGDASSKKVETATRSMVASIQRQIAATEAGGQSSRKYQESLASLRGVDVNVLKPYLDSLDAAKAKQEAVANSAQNMGGAINGAQGAFSGALAPLNAITGKLGALDTQAQQAASSFANLAKGLLIGAAAGLSIEALRSKIVDTIQAMADLKTTSEKTGSSVESLSKLGLIARQSGSDLDGVATSLTKLAKGLAGSDNETKGAGKALEFLGISARNANGDFRDTADVYTEIAKKLDTFKDGTGKTAIAMELFGKAGAEQLATLKLLAQSGDIAVKVTDEQATASRNYTRDLMKLGAEKNMLFKTLAVALLPTMSDFVKVLLDASRGANVLNGEAKKLAADHSIEDWADQGAIEIAKLIDTIKTIPKVFAIAQNSIKTLTATGTAIGTALFGTEAETKQAVNVQKKALADAGDAFKALLNGDTSATEKAMQSRITARKAERDFAVNADAKDLRARNADAIAASGKNKPALNYSSAKEGSAKATRELIDENEALLASVKKGLAASQAEIDMGKALTPVQKEIATLYEEISNSKKVYNLETLLEVDRLLQVKLANEASNAAREQQLKLIKQSQDETAKQADTAQKTADGIKQQAAEQEAANAVFGKGRTAIAEYRLEESRRLLQMAEATDTFSPAYVTALNEQVKAQERLTKAFRADDFKQLQQKQDEYARSVKELGIVYADEAKLAGLSNLEREKIIVARKAEIIYAKQIAEIDRTGGQDAESEAARAVLRAQAAADKTIAIQSGVAKAVQDEWAKTADAIEKSLTDALLRGFESGKGFAQNLRDTLVNIFKTLVLKPIISDVIRPVSGAIGNVINSAVTGAGGGGLGSLLGLASNTNTLLNIGSTIGTGFAGTVGSTVGSLFGATAGNTALGTTLGLGYGSSSAAAAAATAAGATTAAEVGGAAVAAEAGLAAIGPVGWVALAALAAYAIFSKESKPSSSTGESSFTFDASGRQTANRSGEGAQFATFENPAFSKIVTGLASDYSATAKALGIIAKETSFAFGGNTGEGGEHRQIAVGGGVVGGSIYQSGETPESPENLKLLAARAVFSALQGSELPKFLQGAFDGLSAGALSADQIGGVLDGAKALKTFHDQLLALPFAGLADLSFKATQGLISAAGGLDKLQSGLADYYNNFYSEAEKTARTSEQITQALAAVNIEMPKTRDEFRAQFDAAQKLGDSGAPVIAALLSVEGAFASIVPAAQSAADATAKAAADMAQAAAQLQNKLSSVVSDYLNSDELRGFRAGEIQRGLAGGGVNLTVDQILNATRADARALYESYAARGDTTAQGAILDVAKQFSDLTTPKAQTQYAGGDGGSGATAAVAISNAWQQITDSIYGEVERIRGLLAGTGAEGFAMAQARFATITAQARAGDAEAAKLLPGLSNTLLGLAENNVSTLTELKRIQGQTASSLSDTGSILSSRYNTTIPSTFQSGSNDLTAQISQLNAQIASLVAIQQASARDIEKLKNVTVYVTQDGRAMQSEAVV